MVRSNGLLANEGRQVLIRCAQSENGRLPVLKFLTNSVVPFLEFRNVLFKNVPFLSEWFLMSETNLSSMPSYGPTVVQGGWHGS